MTKTAIYLRERYQDPEIRKRRLASNEKYRKIHRRQIYVANSLRLGLIPFRKTVMCADCCCRFYFDESVENGVVIRSYEHLTTQSNLADRTELPQPRTSFICQECAYPNRYECKPLSDEMLVRIEEEGEQAAMLSFVIEEGISITKRAVPEFYPKRLIYPASQAWYISERQNMDDEWYFAHVAEIVDEDLTQPLPTPPVNNLPSGLHAYDEILSDYADVKPTKRKRRNW